MTDRELLKQALEALELLSRVPKAKRDYADRAIVALRERLAQPQRTHWEGCEEVHPECRKLEPVAWISEGGDVSRSKRYMDEMGFKCNPLYTAPPRREWVGLTLDQKKRLNDALNLQGRFSIIDAIEAKLREKNNG